ncbi:MAG: hypothetical protein ACYTGP_06690 [Planctomycetota bacterium]
MTPAGIDLGQREVRVVCAPSARAESMCATAPWRRGETTGDLVQTLRDAGLLRLVRAHGAVVSPPREQVVTECVTLPPLSGPVAFTAAVRETARRHGFDAAALECRVVRTGATASDGREEWLVLAVPRVTADRIRTTLVAAGARDVAVTTHVEALTRLAIDDADVSSTPASRVVVEVDTAGSTLLVLRGGGIAACRRLAIGGADLDEAVAAHLRLDLAAAAALRRRRMEPTAVPSATHRAAFAAVRGLLGDLGADVRVGLRRIGASFRGPTPEEILLVGSEAREPGLTKVLAEAGGVPVRATIAPSAHDRLRTSCAVAAGLSRAGRGGAVPITARGRAA